MTPVETLTHEPPADAEHGFAMTVAAANEGLVAFLAAMTRSEPGALDLGALACLGREASADDVALLARRLEAYADELVAAAEACGHALSGELVDNLAAAIEAAHGRLAMLRMDARLAAPEDSETVPPSEEIH